MLSSSDLSTALLGASPEEVLLEEKNEDLMVFLTSAGESVGVVGAAVDSVGGVTVVVGGVVVGVLSIESEDFADNVAGVAVVGAGVVDEDGAGVEEAGAVEELGVVEGSDLPEGGRDVEEVEDTEPLVEEVEVAGEEEVEAEAWVEDMTAECLIFIGLSIAAEGRGVVVVEAGGEAGAVDMRVDTGLTAVVAGELDAVVVVVVEVPFSGLAVEVEDNIAEERYVEVGLGAEVVVPLEVLGGALLVVVAVAGASVWACLCPQ